MRKNEKHVILCLLEVARRGAKFGKRKKNEKKIRNKKIKKCAKGTIVKKRFYLFKSPLFCLSFFKYSIVFFMCVFVAGMLAPMLVQMERQIDREIAADNKANGVAFGTQTDDDTKQTTSTETENGLFDTDSDDEDAEEPMLTVYGPQPQIITNDLKSLDEMVSAYFRFHFQIYLYIFFSSHKSKHKNREYFMKRTCHCMKMTSIVL